MAYVAASLRSGPGQVNRLGAALSKHDVQLDVFAGVVDESEPAQVPIHVIPSKLLVASGERTSWARSLLLVSPSLLNELVRSKPDVIMAGEYGLQTFWALIAARVLHCPFLIFQENRQRAGKGLSLPKKLFRRWILQRADGLVANTVSAATEAVQLHRVVPQKIRTITLGVPPSPFEMENGGELGVPETTRPVFLSVGRLETPKNIAVMVEAADELVKHSVEFSVWIVGDGPQRAALQSEIEQRDLLETFVLVGPVPNNQIGHLYGACDVFVMPTSADYRSRAVLEAIAYGKPIIDSRFDGNAGDTVIDERNGLLFDPNNVHELVAHMRRLVDDPEFALRLGRESARISASMDIDAAAADLRNYLEVCLARRD